MSTANSSTAAGWYLTSPGVQGYWDGKAWTGQSRPANGFDSPGYGPPVAVVRKGGVVIPWLIAILTGFYMLPWAIAATRQTHNRASIGLWTLLLGWTGIGWLIALIIACTARPSVVYFR